MSNIWLLTEERPKREVVARILQKVAADAGIACFIDTIRILPVVNFDNTFNFLYEVIGFKSKQIKNVYIKTASGSSSYVDYLVFYQETEPKATDSPLYAIEETKTDDAESRNTGIFQRASKFVYIDFFYPRVKKVMLYSLQVAQKEKQTPTNLFGTKCLLNLGVEILGKRLDPVTNTPFKSIEELIQFKSAMKLPPASNIPILIEKYDDRIEISGRLVKDDRLAHDPSIGALSLICATLRRLGWQKRLVITRHGLEQKHIKGTNKFVQIATKHQIEFDGLKSKVPLAHPEYWHYETQGEKLGTIFIHLAVENFTSGSSLFENHAGCEKGYFITKEGHPLALQKYRDRALYKAGNKSQIVQIPDLILMDIDNTEIINVEGKKYIHRKDGIKELSNYDAVEDLYIKPHYPDFKILRTVVLYGGVEERIMEMEVGFLLNKKGKLVLGIKPPKLFTEAVKNLLEYWNPTAEEESYYKITQPPKKRVAE